MSANWDLIVNPVTFQPEYTLKVNNQYVGINITVEAFHDKVYYDEHEFMRLLLEGKNAKLTDDDIAEVFVSFKQKFTTT